MRLDNDVEVTEDDSEWTYTLSPTGNGYRIILFRDGHRVGMQKTVTRWGALHWAKNEKKRWARSARVEKGTL